MNTKLTKLNQKHFKRAKSPLRTPKFWAFVLIPVIVILAIALPILLTWEKKAPYNAFLANPDGSYTFRGDPDWKDHTQITVPATHNDKPVTIIGYNAFKDFTKVTKITLPETIKEIQDGAFWGCTALVEINLPGSITTIQQSTFRDCTSLELIIWPSDLTFISAYMFANCTSLKTIYLTSASMVQASPTSFDNIKESVNRIWISGNDLFKDYWNPENEYWIWANGDNRDLFRVGMPPAG